MSDTNSIIVKAEESAARQPSMLKRIWEGWKKIGLFIGKVNLYILTFIIYWTIFSLTAIITQILRRDFLNIRPKKEAGSHWAPLPESDPSIEKHQRQF